MPFEFPPGVRLNDAEKAALIELHLEHCVAHSVEVRLRENPQLDGSKEMERLVAEFRAACKKLPVCVLVTKERLEEARARIG